MDLGVYCAQKGLEVINHSFGENPFVLFEDGKDTVIYITKNGDDFKVSGAIPSPRCDEIVAVMKGLLSD